MTAIANLPDLRPSLLLDFANSGRVDPRIQCTRASSATCFGPDGKLRTVAANVPRIDYDPVTGKCLGLLVEEARTNLVQRNGNAGAAVGVLESGGALPTGWSAITANGLTAEVLSVGAEDGIPYVDVRFYGTSTTTYQGFVFGNISGYVPSTAYTGSFYVKLIGGAIPANGNAQFKIRYSIQGGATDINSSHLVNAHFVADKLAANRLTVSGTTSANATGSGQLLIVFNYDVGTAIDFSVRLGLPQLEAGGGATSPILTSGAAATRAGDATSMEMPAYNDISICTDFMHGGKLANTRALGLYASSATASSVQVIGSNMNGTSSAGVIASPSGPNTTPGVFPAISGRVDRVAFSRGGSNGAMLTAARGIALASGTHSGTTAAMQTLAFGNSTPAGALTLNGWVRRVSIWLSTLSQPQLNKITEV
ncbi:phage head spike fiber domain-containing protein [Comamonas kerstersii]|uniref:phage head spike fiber domain-containing protein n=1 Tax=Comamonas kerstersii TaxID=225992 RepID=UPI00266F44E7|nr:hypothetical protein [Comamonas kerstersii]